MRTLKIALIPAVLVVTFSTGRATADTVSGTPRTAGGMVIQLDPDGRPVTPPATGTVTKALVAPAPPVVEQALPGGGAMIVTPPRFFRSATARRTADGGLEV